jgi:DNA-binding MarR family transcriptional regulator
MIRDGGEKPMADGEKGMEQVERTGESGFRALIRVSGLLDRIMQPYFGRFGISRSQWGVLRTLHRAEQEGMQGLRLMDLGDRLLVRPPSVTGLLDRLERLGYVVRNSSSADLRCKEVCLTVAGRGLVERILQGHANQIATLMRGLDASEQRQLHFLLERLGAHLESMLDAEDHVEVR